MKMAPAIRPAATEAADDDDADEQQDRERDGERVRASLVVIAIARQPAAAYARARAEAPQRLVAREARPGPPASLSRTAPRRAGAGAAEPLAVDLARGRGRSSAAGWCGGVGDLTEDRDRRERGGRLPIPKRFDARAAAGEAAGSAQGYQAGVEQAVGHFASAVEPKAQRRDAEEEAGDPGDEPGNVCVANSSYCSLRGFHRDWPWSSS